MKESTDEEYSYARRVPAVPHLHERYVQVPHGPPVHGHVPVAPERIDVIRVPPVAVEVAIGELEQLADQVQE